ncbi:NADH-ubiquinone oxidoreductase-F iron-sulfur binding region domain-containing protein [Nocardioides pocheonensis]|uniref:NADH-quinone oxidoreductase subunit F n=1 Tax=Nocardioides pocheonensis TaxID=661485 RepID=A0A3N0GWM3_9ACTN|nr:NADH-ubiquinone oxidoreductase-F iron-sulfur binding region domain-containing protein [Nocardioides pocheonensis]RNM16492.1 NADH-quinone oxidoreductase subunit F [Nocardioides pocheonensis]
MTVTTDVSAPPLGETRLLADHPGDRVPQVSTRSLIDLLERAGLTGRGGAGFPTARKLAALEGRRPVVVGNAMEGEPLSHKDAVLLHKSPDLVLDGLEVLRHALRPSRTVLALGARVPMPPERRGIEVRRLLDSFVAGQETALVNQLNGHDPVPTDPSTPVFRKGVGGRPTLVLNAETLAQLALLVRYGATWFRSQGLQDDPGTFLISLTESRPGLLNHPGVLEARRGVPLREVLERGGADPREVQAVLIGGYHGAWIPGHALDTPLSRPGLAPFGATPGAGIVHLLETGACPLDVSARVATYLASQSARQCGPCLNGLPHLARTMTRLARPGADPALLQELDRVQHLVTGRGACKHPDGTVRFVSSTLRVFDRHVTEHLHGHCDSHRTGGVRR